MVVEGLGRVFRHINILWYILSSTVLCIFLIFIVKLSLLSMVFSARVFM